MFKKLLKNLSFVLVLNALIKPLWIFGVDRVFQNRVGEELYGQYFTLFSLAVILSVFLDIGLTGYNTRNIAKHPGLFAKYLGKTLSLKGLLVLVYFLVLIVSFYCIGYESNLGLLLFVLGVNQGLNSFILYLRSNLAALHLFTLDSLVSVLDKTMLVLFFGIAFIRDMHYVPSLLYFAFVQTLVYGLVMLVLLWITLSYLKGEGAKKIDKKWSLMVLRKSYPYALLALLVGLYLRIDAIMLQKMLPNGNFMAGLYAQSYRIIDALAIGGYLVAGILLPYFSKMIKEKNLLKPIVNRLAFFGILGAVLFSVAGSYFSEQIIGQLYHFGHPRSVKVFAWLVYALIPVAVYYVYSTYLTAKGKIWLLNRLAVIGLVLNVLLNFLLIPYFDAVGAAMASVITQSSMGLLYIYYSYRDLGKKA